MKRTRVAFFVIVAELLIGVCVAQKPGMDKGMMGGGRMGMGGMMGMQMMQGSADTSAAKSGGPMGKLSPANPPASDGKAANQGKPGTHESHH